MELTITLTDEQAAVIKDDAQKYLETLANDRIVRQLNRSRASKILKVSSTDKDLDIAVLAVEAANPSYEPMEGGA
jgi:hypothetical protein